MIGRALAAVGLLTASLVAPGCSSNCNKKRIAAAYDEALAKQAAVVEAAPDAHARLIAERDLAVLRAQREAAVATCADANN